MRFFLAMSAVVFAAATVRAENIYDCSGRYLPNSSKEYKRIEFLLASTEGANPYSPPIESGTILAYEADGLRIFAGNTHKRVTAIAEVRPQQNGRFILRSSAKADSADALSIEFSQVDTEDDPNFFLSLNCLKR